METARVSLLPDSLRAALGPRPDRGAIEAFLRLGVNQLIAIPNKDEFPPDWPEGAPTLAHWISDRAAALEWAVAWNERGVNIYWSANQPVTELGKKANKSDIVAVRCLYADDDRRQLEQGTTALPPPSLVIDSGGGLQPIWLLDAPITLDSGWSDYEARNRHLEQVLGADHCHNVDRVLRLPGTVNWPNALKRTRGRTPVLARLIVCEPTRRYPLDAFPPAAGKASAEVHTVEPGERVPPARLAEIVTDPALLRLLVAGAPAGADRSKALYGAVAQLVRAGLDDPTIAAIIGDEQYGISAHVYDQGNPGRTIDRCISSARDVTETAIAHEEGIREAVLGPFVPPESEPGDPWPAAFLAAHQALEAHRGTGAAAGGKLGKPAFTPALELLKGPFPTTPWVIQGLVTEMSVGITSAEPKSIKTWIELENALAVATGTKSMGEFVTGPPRAVALFLAEDDVRAARNRLFALCVSRGIDPEKALKNVHVCCRQHLDITQDNDLTWIIASCRQIPGLALVVVDPLRDVHSADENDSTGMADVMGRLRMLRDICRVSVRAPHHAKKETSGRSERGGQNMRGSSAIHGALDCGLYLDGLDTDGKARWTVRAHSEIKAARGAGTFTVTLEVEDNAAGEALKATWTVDTENKAAQAAKVEDADETAVLTAIVQNRTHLPMSQLWRLVKLPDGSAVSRNRVDAAVARLLAGEKIERNPRFVGTTKVYQVVGVTQL